MSNRSSFTTRAIALCALGLAWTLFSTAQAGDWFGSAEALFLDQHNDDQTVVSQMPGAGFPPGESAVLFTDSISPDMQPGIEIAIGYRFNNGTVIEGSYFGLQEWSETASVTDPTNNLQAPLSNFGNYRQTGIVLNDFVGAYQQGLVYSSELHNIELIVARQLTGPIWFVGGFRYFSFDESMDFFSYDTPAPTNDVGRYNVGVENRMFGLQVGGRANYQLLRWLEMTGQIDAGLFANWVESSTLFQNSTPNLSDQGSASTTGLAGVIDVEWMLAVNHGPFKFFAGYRVLLFSGVSRASAQFDFAINEDPEAVIGNVDHQGTLLLHGPFGGVLAEF